MALNDTVERIKVNVANIGSVMMTGKTIEERVAEAFASSNFYLQERLESSKRKGIDLYETLDR